jgi:hypothetical protein
MHTTKLGKTADDVKGLKLITTGRKLAQAAVLIGAAPARLSPGNYFQALQGAVANGVDYAVVIAAAKEHLPMDFAALGAPRSQKTWQSSFRSRFPHKNVRVGFPDYADSSRAPLVHAFLRHTRLPPSFGHCSIMIRSTLRHLPISWAI